MAETVRTTCPYCGVGCGVIAVPDKDGGVGISGDPDHPANRGALCTKGMALGDTLGAEGRLLYPERGGARIGWDEAIGEVAQTFRRVIEESGPEAVAFYVSGQLLSEDYYVANKLMKGFIGAANIDTNSRLCMAAAGAAQTAAFGEDAMPGCYEDLDLADLAVLAGSNAALCHPVLFSRLRRARRERGQKLVVIDPRHTASAEEADLFLPLRPGSDTVLFNGLLVFLHNQGVRDDGFLARHVDNAAEALAAARAEAADIHTVAARTGLAAVDVRRFYEWFASHEKTLTLYSQGINQSVQGMDKARAIFNVHLLTGRIGRPGMGPFSLTGQPNAMGGREVGGMASTLAAHMGFSQEERQLLGRFWQTDAVAAGPGLKALDLFRALDEGRIRALWVMGTNPAVSLPEADLVRRALAGAEFLVVSDCERRTDTADLAHILLPAAPWGERSGTVTNSERCISRQRAFRPPLGEARPDWRIISDVAAAMGHGWAFSYRGPADIFREHAALSAFENHGRRLFDIGAMADIGDDDYERMTPFQWPRPKEREVSSKRLFADGRFATRDGRARMAAVGLRRPAARCNDAYPLLLSTGRLRDQWHTMTRTGRAARLGGHDPEPFVAVHPEDARALGLADGGLARLESRHGDALLRVRCDSGQRRGEVFAPIHWSDVNAARAVIGRLTEGEADPLSGQPGLKMTPAALYPLWPQWQAVLLHESEAPPSMGDYWARRRIGGGYAFELAGFAAVAEMRTLARALLRGDEGQWLACEDAGAGYGRYARFEEDRLVALLHVGLTARPQICAWLEGRLGQPCPDFHDRMAVLAGRPPDGDAASGRMVCACHQVSEKDVIEAIARDRLDSVEALGHALGVGTGCGGCLDEVRALLADCAA